jgi:hypothetical protein
VSIEQQKNWPVNDDTSAKEGQAAGMPVMEPRQLFLLEKVLSSLKGAMAAMAG